jgi:importin subunit alpha-1
MNDEDVIVDACWALSYISDGTTEKIDAIVASGVCQRLVELLTSKSEAVQTPALRAVGNIVTGTDQQTQVVINLGVLQCLSQLLGSRKVSLVKETCWTISNITAGVPQQIQAVIEANLFPQLIHLLQSGDFEVKKEAAWAVSNATSGGNPDQIRYLVHQGCIKPFCDLLAERDHNLVVVALDCLENILKVGKGDMQDGNEENPFAVAIEESGGIEKIEDLTVHKEMEVCQKATKIIDEYFGSEDEPAVWEGTPNDAFRPVQNNAFPPSGGNNFNFNFN